MAERIRVDRALHRRALLDAIQWTVSLIQAGNPDPEDAKLLARYRQALAKVGGPVPEPEGKLVTIAELSARGRTENEEA